MAKTIGMRLTKAVLASFLVSALALLASAFGIYALQVDPGMGPLLVYGIYVLSCLAGGWLLGRMMQTRRMLWGLAAGGSYFLLLGAAALAAGSVFVLSADGLIAGLLCLAGGGLGGVLS